MHELPERLRVLEKAVEVRLLHVEGGDLRREHGAQRPGIGPAVLCGHDAQLVAGAVAVGAHGVDDVRVRGGGDQCHAALAVSRHRGGLGHGGRPVVHGGVRHVHAGQLADHRLILEDGLQHALAHFRLIRGVGGEEFFLCGDGADDGGNVVVVGAGAAQDGREHAVFRGDGGHRARQLQLAHARGQVERLIQQHILRHVPVELAPALRANGAEHFLPLLRSGGNVAHGAALTRSRRAPDNRRRRAVPRCR